ncbi:hypothetical protein SAMN02745166_00904 [Prosthecobacter debontii]|uniref:Uncharacterized protein n=1 Tax=Prosthecobacter debontii TaxID=48467 RepID=A0A1T4WYM7_9BACT|nr:hypothetical protein [Prosthecobacter debontii]SKA82414.1 hypothetical protein SAMN02745166_00904 [Prosthecobacter debontii]
MKSLPLTVSLILGGLALVQADPAPKLVPRPIPGLETLQPTPEPSVNPQRSAFPPVTTPTPVIKTGNPDQARVVFIHRRSTLPPELIKDLPVRDQKTADSFQLQVKQGPVKIIPKERVAELAKAQD